MNKKNIMVIITDQQRIDTLGFRNPLCETPHMDRIYKTGISFDDCITPSPLCGPARTSIFTGQYPHQIAGICPPKGSMLVNDEITESDTTMMTNDYSIAHKPVFPNLLRSAGYETYYAGKWHLGNDIIHDWFPNACGYDTKEYSTWCKENNITDGWAFNDHSVRSKRAPFMSCPKPAEMEIDPKNHGDAWITDKAINYIKNRDKTKPFFTVCSVNGPHPPFKVPEPYLSFYEKVKDKIPCPENFLSKEGKPDYLNDSYYRKLAEDYSVEWEEWQKSVSAYWGLTKLIDDQVGKIWQCLEDEKILENTMVILISDHGEMMGSHGLWQKMESYEEALRVPMLVSAPWIKQKVRSDANVSLLDFVPTVLDVAGIKYDASSFEGESLYPLMQGEQQRPNRITYAEHRPLGVFHGAQEWRMVLDKKYKYVWAENDKEQFYNMQNDRGEINNLIQKCDKNLINNYRELLIQWAHKTNDPLKVKLSDLSK